MPNNIFTINHQPSTSNQSAINHKLSTINQLMEEAIEWYIENIDK